MALPEVKSITAEEYAQMPDTGYDELVEGRIVPMPPPNFVHGIVQTNVARAVGNFVADRRLGIVSTEGGVITKRLPDSVRGPDVSFVSRARYVQKTPLAYLDVAPELIVEVLSEGNSASEMDKKLTEYFGSGVLLVWIVDPATRTVAVHRSVDDVREFDGEASLSGEDVLPGFTLPLTAIFANLDE